MNENACPACRAGNDQDARYCDQCGQHLLPHEDKAEGACPACGGVVEERDEGRGVCASCGLELIETPPEGGDPAAPSGENLAARLTEAIQAKIRGGAPVEQAVADGVRETLAAPADGAASASAKTLPCPLCSAENPEDAPRCAACAIWFEARHPPAECPRCGKPASGAKCRCGAILTLPALLDLLEPSVKSVCVSCKQPYVAAPAACPDCRGKVVPADGLRAFARA
jgi:predicted RNA-binding Zn-ribbon protein involved in translation (DUF1610 family)